MIARSSEIPIARRLVDSLYLEAMVLSDEARAYFDRYSSDDRAQLAPVLRVAFSCESLKVTTRLMHVIAWLLTRRAVESGEMEADQALTPNYRLGQAVATDRMLIEKLPDEARALIFASCDLYERVSRLDTKLAKPKGTAHSPARTLHHQLEQAF